MVKIKKLICKHIIKKYNYCFLYRSDLLYSSDMSLVIDNKLPDNNLINDKHEEYVIFLKVIKIMLR